MCGDRPADTPMGTPPPYTSGSSTPMVGVGASSSGVRMPMVTTQVLDIRQDPNFVAMGQEMVRLDETQRLMEATLHKKWKSSMVKLWRKAKKLQVGWED